MSCGSTFLYIKRTINRKHLFAFVPSRCKSWSCPKCRPVKANIVREYILENFNSEPLFMLTLTFFHSGSPLETWKNLGSCWNRMRTYISKKYGRFDYLRIVEPHKLGGWPHMHILIKGHVTKVDVVKKIVSWGFGWNMECQRIPVKEAAKYISKYLTKEWPSADADVLRIATKTRIVSVSRGMPAIFTPASEWAVVRLSLPESHAEFMCNAIIQLLKDKGAILIISKPFADGFVIESDVDLQDCWLDTFLDPYIFRVCQGFDFSYLPYGLQQDLDLGIL